MSSIMSMPGTIGGAKIIFQNKIKMEKIGIVGLGFVGGAINSAMDEYSQDTDLILVDPFKGYTNTVADLKDCTHDTSLGPWRAVGCHRWPSGAMHGPH